MLVLITSLELPSCQIKGFVDIFEDFLSIIRQCTGLAHLDLSRNQIGIQGAKRLAAVLPQCLLMSFVDLRDNYFVISQHFATVPGSLSSVMLPSMAPS